MISLKICHWPELSQNIYFLPRGTHLITLSKLFVYVLLETGCILGHVVLVSDRSVHTDYNGREAKLVWLLRSLRRDKPDVPLWTRG
jgi:hypothetical protein